MWLQPDLETAWARYTTLPALTSYVPMLRRSGLSREAVIQELLAQILDGASALGAPIEAVVTALMPTRNAVAVWYEGIYR